MSIVVKKTKGAAADLAKGLTAKGAIVAREIRRMVAARVAQGVDINDRPFAPYSREYGADNPGRPDLDAAGTPGSMVSTLVTTVVARSGVVEVVLTPDAKHAAIAGYHQRGTPKMPARPWLGLSPRDIVKLKKMLIG